MSMRPVPVGPLRHGWHQLKRSDPWLTFIRGLLGMAGRDRAGIGSRPNRAWVRGWLCEQTSAFRPPIEIVVIDLSARCMRPESVTVANEKANDGTGLTTPTKLW
jgi:hypothetical protein